MKSGRRVELLARAARDRQQISDSLTSLAGPIHLAERGWKILQWVKRRPLVAGSALAVLALLGRNKLSRLPPIVLGAWPIGRAVARLLSTSRAAR